MEKQGKIRVGIIGAAGYTGGELLRLLVNHPGAEIVFAQSNSQAGLPVSLSHEGLQDETELNFIAKHHFEIDVLFFCAGHGEAKKFVAAHDIPATVKLIDIGNDFRLQKDAIAGNRTFIYGLPEINREKIRSADSIANPGCFATTIQLGLLPLAFKGLLKEIYSTGITGSTGAGQSLSATSHFSWRANNIQAYKTLTHQHLDEIVESITQLQPNFQQGDQGGVLNFVPWRGDFTRGIFVSSQVRCSLTLDALNELYYEFYKDHPFVSIHEKPISLKQVVNTNKVVIQLEKVGEMLVIHSALDNLLKGASGQGVQNMNLMFGLAEDAGLRLKASGF
jgi:N-acetyl-gamma-glutamyl-phosphate reductase